MPPRIQLKRRRAGPGDDDGWSLTLADMMTLILCFFVVMVSLAKVDAVRFSTVAGTMAKAMGGPGPATAATQPSAPNLAALKDSLATLLPLAGDEVSLKLRPDAVAVELPAKAFFASGESELTTRAREILTGLAPTLRDAPYRLTVEGHTDNLPIATGRFPSNWELSAARAGAVARFLIELGLPPDRLQVAGLADTRPLAGNDTEEGRAANRRVVILVTPAE